MRYLKVSTSVDVGIGPFLDSTDGNTAETALTITQPDIRLKKNGGAWAQKAAAQTLAHEESGWYEVTLDATDTDTIGHLLVTIHESGALPVWQEYHVLAANVYDSLFGAATDKLDVNVEEWNTTAVPPEHTAGYPTVTVKDGTGTGEINTNGGKIAGVELVDVLTTYTGNTLQTGDTYALANGASGFVALKAVVDAISTTLGAAGAGLTAVATAVWASATRLVTAGTNIVLAKGTGVTGFNDLDAAGVRAAVGLTSANLDTQLSDLPTNAELATALGTADDAVLAALATVQADTDNIQTRIPAALVDGRIDASVGAMAANTMTASALATDAVTEIQSGLGAGLDAAGVRAAVGLASANLDTQLGAIDDLLDTEVAAIKAKTDALPTDPADASDVAAAVAALSAAIAALNNLSQANVRTALGLASANLDTQLGAIDDFLDTEVAGIIATLGAAGAGLTALGDARLANLDTAVSSRSTFTGGAVASVTGAVGSVTGNIGGNVVGTVGSVVAPVAITSNVKQGQALGAIPFLMTDTTLHEPMAGLTVTVQRKIDGGAFAAGTLASITDAGSGTYTVNAGAGDMNGKIITFRATATGADDCYFTLYTQP